MKRLLYILLGALASVGAYAQQPTAQQVLDGFLAQVEKQTLVSDISMTVTENGRQSSAFKGKVKMRDTRFWLTLMGHEAAYDGKTFYLYSEDTDELSLSRPAKDELMEANPVLFAREMRTKAAIRLVKSGRDDRYVLEFVPRDSSLEMEKFTLTIRKGDWMPLEITVKDGTHVTTIRFLSPSFQDAVPSFVIRKEGAYINDLR